MKGDSNEPDWACRFGDHACRVRLTRLSLDFVSLRGDEAFTVIFVQRTWEGLWKRHQHRRAESAADVSRPARLGRHRRSQ